LARPQRPHIGLTLGFMALLGLTALTATSTDGMARRLGSKHWQRLHQAIYLRRVGIDPLLSAVQAYRINANIREWLVRLVRGPYSGGARFFVRAIGKLTKSGSRSEPDPCAEWETASGRFQNDRC